MVEKYKRKRKSRIRPARTALFLLVSTAIVCTVILGGRMIGDRVRDDGAGDAGETVSETSVQNEAQAAEDAASGTPASQTEDRGADAPPHAYARFADLYYYEEERLDRYLQYEAAHSELSSAEVVWQVDVDLDKPFYEDPAEIADVDSEQALVNKHFKFPDDFVPAELVTLEGDYRVTPATKEAYERMKADATAAGCAIRVGSAYRSIEYQKSLYARYLEQDPNNADNYSARPGFSEHHTGRTVDLIGPSGTLRGFVGTKEADWVRENAWNYGFIVRYTTENEAITGYESEPWHITYIGKEAAALMREHGIGSLEEYVAKYVRHLPG
ncbi:MAG: M15 family metallopeptidase [Clostridiales Family XIII bacterium]|jgi:D-alanyl-D-alanine carboxypeptidase|nr:M15 family metallopeptidase [Clostridiales Family XIII bacterium]